jgi:hypothetical protein
MDEENRRKEKIAFWEGDKGFEPRWGRFGELLAPRRLGKESFGHNETLTAKREETSEQRGSTCLTWESCRLLITSLLTVQTSRPRAG